MYLLSSDVSRTVWVEPEEDFLRRGLTLLLDVKFPKSFDFPSSIL